MKRLTSAVAIFAIAWIQDAGAQTLGARIQSANDELLNRGNLAVATDIFLPTYTSHSTGVDAKGGPETIRQFVRELRAAFPDLHVDVQILMEQPDKVSWLRTHRGTHRGAYMGVAPTGRQVVWQEMVVTRYEAGKVAEEWSVSDLGERLRTP